MIHAPGEGGRLLQLEDLQRAAPRAVASGQLLDPSGAKIKGRAAAASRRNRLPPPAPPRGARAAR